MSEQLWRECEFSEAEGDLITWGDDGVEQPELTVRRLSSSALLIEDGIEAAAERLARFEFKRSPWQGSAKITWETASEWEREKYLRWARECVVAAAVGKEKT